MSYSEETKTSRHFFFFLNIYISDNLWKITLYCKLCQLNRLCHLNHSRRAIYCTYLQYRTMNSFRHEKFFRSSAQHLKYIVIYTTVNKYLYAVQVVCQKNKIKKKPKKPQKTLIFVNVSQNEGFWRIFDLSLRNVFGCITNFACLHLIKMSIAHVAEGRTTRPCCGRYHRM